MCTSWSTFVYAHNLSNTGYISVVSLVCNINVCVNWLWPLRLVYTCPVDNYYFSFCNFVNFLMWTFEVEPRSEQRTCWSQHIAENLSALQRKWRFEMLKCVLCREVITIVSSQSVLWGRLIKTMSVLQSEQKYINPHWPEFQIRTLHRNSSMVITFSYVVADWVHDKKVKSWIPGSVMHVFG